MTNSFKKRIDAVKSQKSILNEVKQTGKDLQILQLKPTLGKRQQTPNSKLRQPTPKSKLRQPTPKSKLRQPTPI